MPMQAVENTARNCGGTPSARPIGTIAASAAAWLVVNAPTMKIAKAIVHLASATTLPMALTIAVSFAAIHVSANQAIPNSAIRPISPDNIVLCPTTSLMFTRHVRTITVATTPITIWMTIPVLNGTSSPASSGKAGRSRSTMPSRTITTIPARKIIVLRFAYGGSSRSASTDSSNGGARQRRRAAGTPGRPPAPYRLASERSRRRATDDAGRRHDDQDVTDPEPTGSTSPTSVAIAALTGLAVMANCDSVPAKPTGAPDAPCWRTPRRRSPGSTSSR